MIIVANDPAGPAVFFIALHELRDTGEQNAATR